MVYGLKVTGLRRQILNTIIKIRDHFKHYDKNHNENIKEGCINNCNTSAPEDQVQKENPEHY